MPPSGGVQRPRIQGHLPLFHRGNAGQDSPVETRVKAAAAERSATGGGLEAGLTQRKNRGRHEEVTAATDQGTPEA